MSDTNHAVRPHEQLAAEGDLNYTAQRARWDQHLDQQTKDVLSKDATVFLHQSLSTPCLDVLVGAEGVQLTSLSGKTYIDFHGNSVHQLGYQNPYIINRVKQQLEAFPFCPRRFSNPPAVALAERLVGLTQHQLSRVLFAPGGTSAISMALKLARVATGKFKTISMYDAFHGASMDSISVGGEYLFQQDLGPLLAGSIHVPPVDHYRGMWHKQGTEPGDLAYADYIEYVIEKEGDVGALLAETIRSTTIHVPSKAYWQRIRQICDRHGVLLILDEIPIAFGRTGKQLAFEHFGITPDILVLGKGLGAGLIPMAAMLCRESLHVTGHVSLGHFTHEKSPLGAAAALGMLDYMDEQNVLAHANTIGKKMQARLDTLKTSYEVVGDVRGIGLLWGVELVSDREAKTPHPELAEKILYRCLEKGLSFKVSGGNVLSLYPPLVINEAELEKAMDILEEAIQSSLKTTH